MCTCSRVPLGPEDEEAQRGMRNVTIDKVAGELPATDVLVCLLPLTDATRNVVNAPLLAHLKRGAVFINAARGEHVVEEDLLAALDSGAQHSMRSTRHSTWQQTHAAARSVGRVACGGGVLRMRRRAQGSALIAPHPLCLCAAT